MPVAKGPKGVAQEMRKFKEGKLHSGSKKGPVVKDRKQAVAIALNQAGMSDMKKKSPEKKMAKGGMVKSSCGTKAYAKGGMVKGTCKGMGAATRGGKYKSC
jgi:hypothetical protein